MKVVGLYTKKNCQLCEVAYRELERIRRDHPFRLEVVDIEEFPDKQQEYGNDIPVIMVENTEVCRHRVNRDALIARLEAGESSHSR